MVGSLLAIHIGTWYSYEYIERDPFTVPYRVYFYPCAQRTSYDRRASPPVVTHQVRLLRTVQEEFIRKALPNASIKILSIVFIFPVKSVFCDGNDGGACGDRHHRTGGAAPPSSKQPQ